MPCSLLFHFYFIFYHLGIVMSSYQKIGVDSRCFLRFGIQFPLFYTGCQPRLENLLCYQITDRKRIDISMAFLRVLVQNEINRLGQYLKSTRRFQFQY